MKYYCEKCECVFDLSAKAELTFRQMELDEDSMGHWDHETLLCVICSDESQEVWMKRIPDYETPEQYEKRTGKLYPDSGAVYWRDKNFIRGWQLDCFLSAKRYFNGVLSDGSTVSLIETVCADPPVPPPDNWRPQ